MYGFFSLLWLIFSGLCVVLFLSSAVKYYFDNSEVEFYIERNVANASSLKSPKTQCSYCKSMVKGNETTCKNCGGLV